MSFTPEQFAASVAIAKGWWVCGSTSANDANQTAAVRRTTRISWSTHATSLATSELTSSLVLLADGIFGFGGRRAWGELTVTATLFCASASELSFCFFAGVVASEDESSDCPFFFGGILAPLCS